MFMVILALVGQMGFAQSSDVAEEKYQACVQECVSFYDNPGHGLRKCVDQCGIRYLQLEMKPLTVPSSCETYEEDCERGPSEI